MEILGIILMIVTFILAIITGIVFNSSIIGKIIASFFLIIIYWMIVGILLIVIENILWSFADKKETITKIYIYSINKESTSVGNFVIGSGNIDNDYRYSYYIKSSPPNVLPNVFILDDVSAKITYIHEDEELQPYIIKYKTVEIINKNKWKGWFSEFKKTETLDDNIEIHVPKGTITQEFKNKLQ